MKERLSRNLKRKVLRLLRLAAPTDCYAEHAPGSINPRNQFEDYSPPSLTIPTLTRLARDCLAGLTYFLSLTAPTQTDLILPWRPDCRFFVLAFPAYLFNHTIPSSNPAHRTFPIVNPENGLSRLWRRSRWFQRRSSAAKSTRWQRWFPSADPSARALVDNSAAIPHPTLQR